MLDFELVGDDRVSCLSLVKVFVEDRPASTAPDRDACSQQWLQESVETLQSHWPQQQDGFYRDKIVLNDKSLQQGALPCSFLLVLSSDQRRRASADNLSLSSADQCIGHGRLTECFQASGGEGTKAVAVTYLIVDQQHRGKGYGRVLMKLLEDYTKDVLGYHYVYLWTNTAVPFYKACGYTETHRVSLKRDCLMDLSTQQVSDLENVLFRRQKRTDIKQETICLPPSDSKQPDVWMKKRLVIAISPVAVSRQEQMDQIREFAQSHFQGGRSEISLCLPPAATWWQPQIGPSCGLASLELVRLMTSHDPDEPSVLSYLLERARQQGYTDDGEIWNIEDLKSLWEDSCRQNLQEASTLLTAHVKDLSDISPMDVYETLSQNPPSSFWILPYDSNPATKLPAHRHGQGAHYGVVVGMFLLGESNGSDTTSSLSGEDIQDYTENPSWLDTTGSYSSPFLLVQQSLSRPLVIASWDSFVRSNRQLADFSSSAFPSLEGNKRMNLANRVLLVGRR